jgi:hypothetical protein
MLQVLAIEFYATQVFLDTLVMGGVLTPKTPPSYGLGLLGIESLGKVIVLQSVGEFMVDFDCLRVYDRSSR